MLSRFTSKVCGSKVNRFQRPGRRRRTAKSPEGSCQKAVGQIRTDWSVFKVCFAAPRLWILSTTSFCPITAATSLLSSGWRRN